MTKKNTVRKEENLWTRSGAGEEIEILPSFDESPGSQQRVATKSKRVDLEIAWPNQIKSAVPAWEPISSQAHNGRDDVCATMHLMLQFCSTNSSKRKEVKTF